MIAFYFNITTCSIKGELFISTIAIGIVKIESQLSDFHSRIDS